MLSLGSRGRRLRVPRFAAIWLATGLLFAVAPLLAPGSDSRSALLSTLPFAAILAIAAIGQTLVIQQRGLDLSLILAGAGIYSRARSTRPFAVSAEPA